MKQIYRYFSNLGIKERLLLTYALIIIIPSVLIGLQYYATTKSLVSKIVRNNVHEIVVKNNQIIDAKLEQIKDHSLGFVVDNDLQNLFLDIYNIDHRYEMYMLDKNITHLLKKYFLHSPDIHSVYMATSHYVFGNNSPKGYMPDRVFHQTELYDQTVQAEGRLTWASTYSFIDMFNQRQMEDVNFNYRYMFSALKLINHMNFMYSVDNQLQVENPILMVNFTDDFFQKIFANNIPIDHMYYFVIAQDGTYVTHQDQDKIGQKADVDWLEQIIQTKSGIDFVNIEGANTIITYDSSETTGWISAFAIDESVLINDITPAIRYNILSAIIVLVIIFILVSFVFSNMITKPVQRLITAFNVVGNDFSKMNIPEEGSHEFRKLIYKFNSMNEKIQQLIEENYKAVIMKKEAEIKALNTQLDPHFMYNTLNIINLKLIKHGQDETSDLIMSLSTMLKYSLEAKRDLILLHKDLEYTKSYIHIMSTRFEDRFKVIYNIDPRLNEYYVPKFFLQPLVENALIHGFSDIDHPGILRISGWIADHERYFSVEDNGIGMSEDKIEEIMKENSSSIGINNVRQRIRILYGDEYGITIHSERSKGTTIIVRLPL